MVVLFLAVLMVFNFFQSCNFREFSEFIVVATVSELEHCPLQDELRAQR
jgi:hypothetical protein